MSETARDSSTRLTFQLYMTWSESKRSTRNIAEQRRENGALVSCPSVISIITFMLIFPCSKCFGSIIPKTIFYPIKEVLVVIIPFQKIMQYVSNTIKRLPFFRYIVAYISLPRIFSETGRRYRLTCCAIASNCMAIETHTFLIKCARKRKRITYTISFSLCGLSFGKVETAQRIGLV